MNKTKKKTKSARAHNPFDDGAEERLRRMGLIAAGGTAHQNVLEGVSMVYAGLLFDDLCDFYQDQSFVQDDLKDLFTAAEGADAQQKFLLVCLQYDGLGQALPNPVCIAS